MHKEDLKNGASKNNLQPPIMHQRWPPRPWCRSSWQLCASLCLAAWSRLRSKQQSKPKVLGTTCSLTAIGMLLANKDPPPPQDPREHAQNTPMQSFSLHPFCLHSLISLSSAPETIRGSLGECPGLLHAALYWSRQEVR